MFDRKELNNLTIDKRALSFTYILSQLHLTPPELNELTKKAITEGQGEILNSIANTHPQALTSETLEQLPHTIETESLIYTLASLKEKGKLAKPLQSFFPGEDTTISCSEVGNIKFIDRDDVAAWTRYLTLFKSCAKENTSKKQQGNFILHNSVPYDGGIVFGKITSSGNNTELQLTNMGDQLDVNKPLDNFAQLYPNSRYHYKAEPGAKHPSLSRLKR